MHKLTGNIALPAITILTIITIALIAIAMTNHVPALAYQWPN